MGDDRWQAQPVAGLVGNRRKARPRSCEPRRTTPGLSLGLVGSAWTASCVRQRFAPGGDPPGPVRDHPAGQRPSCACRPAGQYIAGPMHPQGHAADAHRSGHADGQNKQQDTGGRLLDAPRQKRCQSEVDHGCAKGMSTGEAGVRDDHLMRHEIGTRTSEDLLQSRVEHRSGHCGRHQEHGHPPVARRSQHAGAASDEQHQEPWTAQGGDLASQLKGR